MCDAIRNALINIIDDDSTDKRRVLESLLAIISFGDLNGYRLACFVVNIGNIQLANALKDYFTNDLFCYAAAQYGNIQMLEWAYLMKLPLTTQVCAIAAYNGHLDVIKWLLKRKCPINADTCIFAAQRGHLHVLEWVIKKCNIDRDVAAAAAEYGQLEILKYLKQENYLYSPRYAYECARISGY